MINLFQLGLWSPHMDYKIGKKDLTNNFKANDDVINIESRDVSRM